MKDFLYQSSFHFWEKCSCLKSGSLETASELNLCGRVVEVVGVVLRDNTYKGVKERGLLSQSMGSSGAGRALKCCPQLKYSGQAFVPPHPPFLQVDRSLDACCPWGEGIFWMRQPREISREEGS